ncbi:MAG: bestrophin family ion channel [Microscillaceae bacterium]
MIVKKNFNPLKVLTYVWPSLVWSLGVAGMVYLAYEGLDWKKLSVPFPVVGILGTALAIFLGFRNTSSYGRWWEARQIWGQIVAASRIWARLVFTFADSHRHQENYDERRSADFKQSLIYKQIAWANALRLQLRGQDDWDEIRPFLSENEFQLLLQKQNKAVYLHKMMGQEIYTAMANGTLGGFDSFQLEGQLAALAQYQSGAERIKHTPVPRQYDYFTRVFLYVFLFFFPLGVVVPLAQSGLSLGLFPITLLVAFVFAAIERTGAVNEDPFENKIQDVPLSALCKGIERDLKEILEESPLPALPQAVRGYIF